MKRTRFRPYVTDGLLIVMVTVYLVMSLTGGTSNSANLVRFGAKVNPLILRGEYWRLVTPIFIHLSLTHILFNGITLYYVGSMVERTFGHFRLLVLFMVSGITGDVFSFAFSPVLSAGASGAIFGLLGAFMMVGETAWRNPFVRHVTKILIVFILLNLVSDFFTVGIDIAGHLGGLIAGFLTAYVVGLPVKRNVPRFKRLVAGVTLGLLLLAVLYRGFVQ